MAHIMKVVSEHLPQESVLTNGAGNFASWLHRFHRYHGLSKGFKTQLAPTSGAMGYGVPAAIAASILNRRVGFTIAGDGDFLMTGQELATAVQYGAKTIILLLNNGVLGTIRMHQEREYPTHVSGSTLINPDFVKLAEAYGYVGVRLTKTEEFEPLFKAALSRKEGTLIEVVLDPEVITTRVSLSQIRANALAK
jgi:acetolactate synthase-1/2/3 large subunit